jgi:histidyl-tRNA synthetase
MVAKKNVGPISGFPERTPAERIAESRLIDKIRRSFELFAFTPIETASVERLEILNAKNNGGIKQQIFQLYNVEITKRDEESNPLEWNWVPSEMALHFDLTVPLARYVVSNLNSLTFPFRRYQIQKVWRGERAQEKRFREFYQCDIDIIGNGKLSLRADAEIPFVISHIFKQLDLGGFKIGISNRGILEGVLLEEGIADSTMAAALAIVDDLPKIGRATVERRLREDLQLSSTLSETVLAVASHKGDLRSTINHLDTFKIEHRRFVQGVNELREVGEHLSSFGMPLDTYVFDLSVVRGLSYYTGTVYETMLDEFPALSICSGGRYDNLASLFSKQNLPGVGISIGLTRLFEYLNDASALDLNAQTPARVLVTVQEPALLQSAFAATSTLRSHGVPAEVYLEERKLEDQLKYATRKGIPLAVRFNRLEEEDNVCVLKNLITRSEKRISFESLTNEVLHQITALDAIRSHSVEAAGSIG